MQKNYCEKNAPKWPARLGGELILKSPYLDNRFYHVAGFLTLI
jgi:hypothetical protein